MDGQTDGRTLPNISSPCCVIDNYLFISISDGFTEKSALFSVFIHWFVRDSDSGIHSQGTREVF